MEVDKGTMGFEETELRLGLPGGNNNNNICFFNGGKEVARKRGFLETVDLKLNLSSKDALVGTDHPNDKAKLMSKDKTTTLLSADPTKPPAKAQVVGWPPVRSFRRNILAEKKNGTGEGTSHEKAASNNTCGNILIASFVKVSMDGAPYLRKVDLKMYKSYKELSDALSNMFSSFTIGNCGADGMRDFMNVSKLVDLLNGTDYVPTYEDKDGDWMLLGDVPWKMFIGSCKRLRIMKGTEATGLAPKAMEKCKNSS